MTFVNIEINIIDYKEEEVKVKAQIEEEGMTNNIIRITIAIGKYFCEVLTEYITYYITQ